LAVASRALAALADCIPHIILRGISTIVKRSRSEVVGGAPCGEPALIAIRILVLYSQSTNSP